MLKTRIRDAVCLPCFRYCHDLQVVAEDTFSSALAESSTTGALPEPLFGLKPDFLRPLSHYLKVVAINETRIKEDW